MDKEFIVTGEETIVSDENGQLQRYSNSKNLKEQLNVHNEIEKLEETLGERYKDIFDLKNKKKNMNKVKSIGKLLLILELPLAACAIFAFPEMIDTFPEILITFGLLPLAGKECVSYSKHELESLEKYNNGTIEAIIDLKLELYECNRIAKSLENNMIFRGKKDSKSKVEKLPVKDIKEKVKTIDNYAFYRGFNKPTCKERILEKKYSKNDRY